MSIRSNEEIMNSLRAIVGESSDDNTLAFIEDVSDTLNHYSDSLKDSTDWKAKYEDNDKEWREKYRNRFFTKPETEPEVVTEPDKTKPMKYEDLFEVKGE